MNDWKLDWSLPLCFVRLDSAQINCLGSLITYLLSVVLIIELTLP